MTMDTIQGGREGEDEGSTTSSQWKKSISASARPEQRVATSKPILRKGEKFYCTYWIARGDTLFESTALVSPLAIQ